MRMSAAADGKMWHTEEVTDETANASSCLSICRTAIEQPAVVPLLVLNTLSLLRTPFLQLNHQKGLVLLGVPAAHAPVLLDQICTQRHALLYCPPITLMHLYCAALYVVFFAPIPAITC
jgi:hypothetical protein